MLARIFRQESQDKVFILLEKGVLPPIPPIRPSVGEMLCSIQLNYNAGFRAQQIHLHLPIADK
jgi:hypothetical protein